MTKKKKHNRKTNETQSDTDREETTAHIEDEETDALTGGATAATGRAALSGQTDNLDHLTGGAEVDAAKATKDEEETNRSEEDRDQAGQ